MKTSDYVVIALLVAVIVAAGFFLYGSQCGCRKKTAGNMAHLAGKKRGGCGVA